MWLYDGEPDHLKVSVRNAQLDEGGYVVLLELDGGEVRLFGTRFPAKYLTTWREKAQLDGAKIVRVVVFGLHPRYEKIKRLIVQSLEGPGSQNLCHTIDDVLERAHILFSISPATNANLDHALKQIT